MRRRSNAEASRAARPAPLSSRTCGAWTVLMKSGSVHFNDCTGGKRAGRAQSTLTRYTLMSINAFCREGEPRQTRADRQLPRDPSAADAAARIVAGGASAARRPASVAPATAGSFSDRDGVDDARSAPAGSAGAE